MWLVIKRIRVDKYHHMLFKDKKIAEEYLLSVGAKRKSAGKYIAKEESLFDGWQSIWFREYTLEYLMVRETAEELQEEQT
jgi:hypothetical protein